MQLATALLHLYDRAIRERFSIPDDCRFVVDGRWRIFSYSVPEQICTGDCQNCSQRDNCPEDHDQPQHQHREDHHDCGPNCKSRGGPGCGRSDCTCKAPDEPVEVFELDFCVTPTILVELQAVGQFLSNLQPNSNTGDEKQLTISTSLTEAILQAIAQTGEILVNLSSFCRDEQNRTPKKES
jgi:hypothetical protein